MTRILIARTFGPGQRGEWTQMAAALARSAARHCPGWAVDIHDEAPREALSSPLGSQGTVWNTHKLDAWCRALDGLSDGTEVLLIDADTLIVNSLDPVWDRRFDFAYTVKPKGSRFPFNAGVIFLRLSDRVRLFMTEWRTVNRRMLDDARLYQVWRRTYGGVNQSALGKLLKENRFDLTIATLPCVEWNCEDSTWPAFHPERTRIIHYKGELRTALFPMFRTNHVRGALRPMVKVWRDAQPQVSA